MFVFVLSFCHVTAAHGINKLNCTELNDVRLLLILQNIMKVIGSWFEVSKWCTSKPDPSNLYQDEGWWLALAGVEMCQWSKTHHLDPPDLSWHGCYSDWGPAASGGQTVLANNRNGGRLRLIASRHWWWSWFGDCAVCYILWSEVVLSYCYDQWSFSQ